jgi:hypothetical protein
MVYRPVAYGYFRKNTRDKSDIAFLSSVCSGIRTIPGKFNMDFFDPVQELSNKTTNSCRTGGM